MRLLSPSAVPFSREVLHPPGPPSFCADILHPSLIASVMTPQPREADSSDASRSDADASPGQGTAHDLAGRETIPSEPSVPTDIVTTLYFVRHGETEYNRQGIMQGSGIDSSLNDTGIAQAHSLASRLSQRPVDIIYSSNLQRAKQTADIVAESIGPVTRHVLDDLKEMDWGIYEGSPPSEERDEALAQIKAEWRSGAFGVRVEGGESILDVQARAVRAARQMLLKANGKTIVAVTHGRFLRVLLASILQGYDLSRMPDFGHNNTSVNRVVHQNGVYRADLLNCTAHLTPS